MASQYQSDVGAIKTLLLKHAKDAFASDEAVGRQWRQLGYSAPPDYAKAIGEYDRFVALLSRFGVELHFLPSCEAVGLDSLYARDASVPCDGGMILCNMGKPQREPEPGAQSAAFGALGVPVHGAISGDGRLEGGDVIWLDERTVVVGRGYRTNDEGIRQFRSLLGDSVDEVMVVALPHWHGPGDVFHLMSMASPIDRDLLLVYSPLLPVPFRQALLERGIELVEVPDDEFETMGCNVLAVGPRRCVALTGNPTTRARLGDAGADVHVFEGREICIKGAGGPTCLTRPITRSSPV
jgi:N-dimethylarginine dimethylaminohydrolase